MKIVIGSDHAGFKLKNAMGDLIRSLGHAVLDVGRLGFSIECHGIGHVRGGRFLRIDVLPRGDGAADARHPLLGCRGVKIYRIPVIGQGAIQIGRILLNSVRLGK